MKWCAPFIFCALSLSLFGAEIGDTVGLPDKKVVILDPYMVETSPLRGAQIHWTTKHVLWGLITRVEFRKVESGSIPGKAGIKSGDELLSIDGRRVKGMKEQDMLALFRGAVMVLEVQSSDAKEPRKIEVKFPEMRSRKEK